MQSEEQLPASSANQPASSIEQEDYIDLQQYWMALKRRWLSAVLVFASTVGLAAAYSLQQEPIYEAKAKLLFQSDDQSLALPALGEGNRGGQASALANQAAIMKSSPLVQQVIENLNLTNDEGEKLKPKSFLGRLTVSPLRETNILEIAYESPDPQEAAEVVDELMAVYQQNNIATNRSEATAAREFIEEQLPKTEQSVRAAEEKLREFKEKNSVIALSQEASSTVEILSELDQQLIEAQASLDDAKTRLEKLTAQLGLPPEQALAAGALSQSEAVQNVLKEYQEVEEELTLKRSRYQPEHPIILRLEERRSALASLLEQRVNTVLQEELPSDPTSSNFNLQLSNLKIALVEDLVKAQVNYLAQKSRIEGLKAEKNDYQDRARILPKLEQRQRELERQLNASQSTYEALLKRLQEVRVAENQNLGNARVVENAALPENPISPKIKLNLALGGILGAMLGIATALVIDARDRTVKTVQEIKDQLGYTVLGSIPLLGSKSSMLPLQDQPRSSVSEAFRMLQANLKFSSVDEALKIIVITSSVPNEGKSTVSANLGMALAELGHRVLIIDSDLRRPSQHQVWEEPNAVGLSNVLVEPNQLNRAIKELKPNLYLLTAGAPPPNPVALLDSKRMTNLLEECSEAYDYVLLDTPPLAVAADAALLGKLAQGMLLVVRPAIADLTSINAAKEMLQRSEQNLLGMVINGVIPGNEPDSYYYYYAQDYYAVDSEQEKSPQKSLFSFGRGKSKK
jgi:capsular exopolysaccharide synthesis family protein